MCSTYVFMHLTTASGCSYSLLTTHQPYVPIVTCTAFCVSPSIKIGNAFQPEPPTKNLDCYLAIKDAQEKEDFSVLTGEAKTIYNNIQSFFNGNNSLWSWKCGYWPDGDKAVYETMNTYVENDMILFNSFSGAPTDSMRMNSQLDLFSAKQSEIFTAIINGSKTVDAGYNELVAYWTTMHGEQMTEEVNAWYSGA